MTVGTGHGLRERKYAVLLALLCVALAIESVSSRGADLPVRAMIASQDRIENGDVWLVGKE